MRRLTIASLFITILGFSNLSQAQFLPEVDFDSWTQILKSPTGVDVHQPKTAALQDSRSTNEIFIDLKDQLTKLRLVSPDDYVTLATGLLDLRDDYRHSRQKTVENRRTLFMLELLVEDVLYVGRKKFPDTFPTVIRDQPTHSESLAPRAAQVEGLYTQTGDVILSKAVGSGSSDFIAFLSQVPQIFSHSTPVYIEPKTNAPLSPEALINDGVKIRSLEPEYASKARIYIYRPKGLGDGDDVVIQKAAQTATDAFVQTMYSRVSDPKIQTAYLYDMSFGGDQTGKTFVCSAISQYIYSTIAPAKGMFGRDAQSVINPYPESNLSRFNSRSNKLLSALSIKIGAVPSPGDLELNRLYDRVGLVIKVDKLEQERVEAAIIDFTLNYLGDQRSHQIIEFLDHLKSIKSDDLLKLEELGIVPQDQMIKLKAALQQVPSGVGLNQIAFFYFMDNVWTPMIRTEVLKQIGAPDQIVGLDATYEIVAKTVKAVWKQKYQALQELMAEPQAVPEVGEAAIAAVTFANSADPRCIEDLKPKR